jgi:hypothetical protein
MPAGTVLFSHKGAHTRPPPGQKETRLSPTKAQVMNYHPRQAKKRHISRMKKGKLASSSHAPISYLLPSLSCGPWTSNLSITQELVSYFSDPSIATGSESAF